jgi:pyridinium-3,5-bisthiocarboxylic acid mononucleotide nickel chelatase
VGKTLYFDCFSGASGDMILGALLDAGVPLEALRTALGSLAIDHGIVSAERVLRSGISATRFRLIEPADAHAVGAGDSARGAFVDSPPVDAHTHSHRSSDGRVHSHSHDRPADSTPESRLSAVARSAKAGAPSSDHHSLADIESYIGRSALSPAGKARAVSLFHRLAEAEAAIHDIPLDRIHLHEVGAIDSIVDIVGAVFAMEFLGADRIVSSPLNVGSGTVTCAHGELPVPAPATVRLLQGVPIYSQGVAVELTTPTGALLVTDYAQTFGPMPAMRVSAVGYGAGDKDFAGHPNVLRVVLGQSEDVQPFERIVSMECEIDDMNPQLFGPLMDRLYAAGALDVYYAPVQMKKNRPGTLVTVIAPVDRRDALAGVLFTETTTIGVRHQEMLRERLERQIVTVETPSGPIRFKVSAREGRTVNASPEFEDCAKAAAERGLPIKEVQAQAIRAWMERESH